MKESKYSEEPIATDLRQVEAGAPIVAITRNLGVSEQTYYTLAEEVWADGGSEIRRLWLLEEENRKLKQLVADLTLDKVMFQELLTTQF